MTICTSTCLDIFLIFTKFFLEFLHLLGMQVGDEHNVGEHGVQCYEADRKQMGTGMLHSCLNKLFDKKSNERCLRMV